MRSGSFRILLLVFLLISFGCESGDTVDLVRPDEPADASSTSNIDRSASDEGTPATIRPPVPFELKLSVNGTLRPNEPISIFASLLGRLTRDDVSISLTVPDIEAAYLTSWRENFEYPTDILLPTLHEDNISTALGTNHPINRIVRIPYAGVYRVLLTASAEDEYGEPDFVSMEKVWLYVTEQGGVVRDSFDPDLIPSQYKAQPGPFRPIQGETNRDPHQATSDISVSTSLRPARGRQLTGAAGWKLVVKVTYIDNHGQPQPLPNAWVKGDMYSIYDGAWDGSFEERTDNNGVAIFNCPGVERDYQATVHADYSNARVIGSNSSDQIGSFYGNGAACDYYADIIETVSATPTEVARVYDNTSTVVPGSRSLTSRSIGKRTFKVYDVSTVYSGRCSFYLNGLLHITTESDCSAIWDAIGLSVQAHEYGHAVYDLALGLSVLNPNCPRPHTRTTSSNLRCALIEGYGEYHGSTVANTHQIDIENGNYVSQGQDGSIIEGGVASLLFDLTDPISASDSDPVNLTGSYLSSLLSSCEVLTNTWKDGRGIDDMVYCLEGTVDQNVVNNYFQTRSVPAIDQRNSAGVGASQSDIRDVWLNNLYKQ